MLIREGIADGSLRPDLNPDLTMHAVINAVVGAQRRLASLGNKVELEYGQSIGRLFRETIRVVVLGLRAEPNTSPTFAAKVGESGSKGVNHARTGRVVIHERSVGIQRSSSKALTARRCDVVSSGAIITVARRPGPPVVVRTSVARIAARSPIIA